MADFSRDQRRINRKHVLDALKSETGSSGGSASDRVNAYRDGPLAASTGDFTFVGSLVLTRFYIDPEKPNGAERRSLWQNMTERIGKAKDPGGWDGNTSVAQLQAIVEGAQSTP
jgi:hypothetical protein